MPFNLADALHWTGLNSWPSAALLLASITLFAANYYRYALRTRAQAGGAATGRHAIQDQSSPEAKSKSQWPELYDNQAQSSPTQPPAARAAQRSRVTWTLERAMRVASSAVILLAAIYIIVFDHGANVDRQKWAFGAVGLVFGHWAKT